MAGFVRVPNEIFEIDLTPIEFKVLVFLLKLADEHGWCFPSAETIARRVRAHPSTARAALRRLEDLGLIIRYNKPRRIRVLFGFQPTHAPRATRALDAESSVLDATSSVSNAESSALLPSATSSDDVLESQSSVLSATSSVSNAESSVLDATYKEDPDTKIQAYRPTYPDPEPTEPPAREPASSSRRTASGVWRIIRVCIGGWRTGELEVPRDGPIAALPLEFLESFTTRFALKRVQRAIYYVREMERDGARIRNIRRVLRWAIENQPWDDSNARDSPGTMPKLPPDAACERCGYPMYLRIIGGAILCKDCATDAKEDDGNSKVEPEPPQATEGR